MTRRTVRTALALLAAYVFALQGILLAAVAPVGAPAVGAQALCLTLAAVDGAPSLPAGAGHDCLAACLATGCATAADAAATASSVTQYPPAAMRIAGFAADLAPMPRPLREGLHYSRAPPQG